MMEHKQKVMTGRYVPAFHWHDGIEKFLGYEIKESPLLHVCSGPLSTFGDVRLDQHVTPHAPGVRANWLALPFKDDSFAAVFADPPWALSYMKDCAEFCKEALRVAKVVYVMSPWLWCSETASRSKIWIREFPGINHPILIVRYERQGYQLNMFNGCAIIASSNQQS